MPISKSAIKYRRVSQRKEKFNKVVRSNVKTAIKKARLKPTAGSLQTAFSALDRAAKKKVIHRRRADRLKSRLSALLAKKHA